MTEEDVRILLSILHDLFPARTMRVLAFLSVEEVENLCDSIDRMTPLLKFMLQEKIGEPIPYV